MGPADVAPFTALSIGGTVLGGFGGRFVTGIAAEHWGWHGAFVALAAVNFACALAIALFLPRERSFRKAGGFGQSLGKMAIHLGNRRRSEEHTSELQSLMRNSYAVFCLKKKNNLITEHP